VNAATNPRVVIPESEGLRVVNCGIVEHQSMANVLLQSENLGRLNSVVQAA
jgi:hypothetical protein